MGVDPEQDGMVWDWIAERRDNRKVQTEVETAIEILRGPQEDWWLVRTRLNNLALRYKSDLDELASGGKWSEVRDQLEELARTADSLAASVKKLKGGAIGLLLREAALDNQLLRKQADLGGLVPELRGGLLLNPGTTIQIELKDRGDAEGELPISPGMQPFQPCEEFPPEWITRSEALAQVCRDGAKRANARAKRGGRRTAIGDTYGAPELQLLRECAVDLKIHDRDVSMTLELARAVHYLVIGRAPSKGWATEPKRRFDRWWNQVEGWVGRESEAPAEVQSLFKTGPVGMVNRRAPRCLNK